MMIKNQRGFTLIEVLVTAAIGVITASVIASYIAYLAKLNNEIKIRRISGNIVHSIAESVRYNLSLFQVSFDNNPDSVKAMLKADKLPLGISNSKLIQRTECATLGCQAYLGYVIVPNDVVRNLYQVKFQVTGTDGEGKWEFEYFITVK